MTTNEFDPNPIDADPAWIASMLAHGRHLSTLSAHLPDWRVAAGILPSPLPTVDHRPAGTCQGCKLHVRWDADAECWVDPDRPADGHTCRGEDQDGAYGRHEDVEV